MHDKPKAEKKIALIYDYSRYRVTEDVKPLLEGMGYEVIHFTGKEGNGVTDFIGKNAARIGLVVSASQQTEVGPNGYQLAHFADGRNIPMVMYTANTGQGGDRNLLAKWNRKAGFYQYESGGDVKADELKAVIEQTLGMTPPKTIAIDPTRVQASRPQKRGLNE
jgi:hypothetical protein